MKQLFAFVLLISVALLLLTVITGIGGFFTAITATWSAANTTVIATSFSQVLWLAGIVVTMVLGYGLFLNMSKGSKGWNSRAQHSQADYTVIDGHAIPTNQSVRSLLEDSSNDFDDWYELSQDEQQVRNL